MDGPIALQRRHFTPLRYPGGKAKLAGFVKSVIVKNGLCDGEYIEPYAGGAAVACELLLQEYVSRIHINDISKPVWSFWRSILDHTDDFLRLIRETPLTLNSWDQQKAILSNSQGHSTLELGFAMFFLNRTNRSGILNAGVIGGRDQSGNWKIDARYNAPELAMRIQNIARLKSRIRLTRQDAKKFLEKTILKVPNKALVYIDPPYFEKGRDLYLDFYKPDDHRSIAETVKALPKSRHWIVSYDNVPEIRTLYKGVGRVSYRLAYSAREARVGTEVMFFSSALVVPEVPGSVRRDLKVAI